MSNLSIALQWRAKRAERLAMDKVAEALKKEETELKKKLMESFKKSVNKSVSNGERLFQFKVTQEPAIADLAKLYKHILKTGEFEFLQRRLNTTAVKERWENNVKVPGVGSIPHEDVSDTQAK